MGPGVGEIDRLGLLDHEADEALARIHRGDVDGLRREALRRKELEHAVIARDIDRADLGHDIRRDQAHDPVEASLRTDGLGHQFAQPPEQQARSAESWPHGLATFRADSRPPAFSHLPSASAHRWASPGRWRIAPTQELNLSLSPSA